MDQDNSVRAWVEDEGGFKHLYIAAKGGMTAPSNLRGLFEGYVNLQKIEWNDAVDMKNVENMSWYDVLLRIWSRSGFA